MRFLHTADWHLGKVMYGERLIEEQAHALEQILTIAEEGHIDALVVSGDVYDRSVPPTEAVRLLDDFLSRLVLGLGVHVIMIAGNHDSPHRLQFASRVLAANKLRLVGSLESAEPVVLGDKFGPVSFHPIPYCEPIIVRETTGQADVEDHDSAMKAAVDFSCGGANGCRRKILIAHAFVAGCSQTESERPLSVGGADQIGGACFEGFNYVALGHLHRPQSAGAPNVHYAGSPLKYSFSETNHRKSVSLVDMNSEGDCEIETVPISPRRDVREIRGLLGDLLSSPGSGNPEDYIKAVVEDSGVILDAMGKLREVYPNVLLIERPALMGDGRSASASRDQLKLDDAALFGAFFKEVTNSEIDPAQTAAFVDIVNRIRIRERESA
jgi:exonuclease SbcD